MLEKLDFAGN